MHTRQGVGETFNQDNPQPHKGSSLSIVGTSKLAGVQAQAYRVLGDVEWPDRDGLVGVLVMTGKRPLAQALAEVLHKRKTLGRSPFTTD